MPDRRRSVRLAAAVSSILSAPAIAVGALAVGLAVAPMAQAQETTSGVRGTISTPDGTPAAGANVRVTDTRTGSTQRTTTSASGQFSVAGLRVGGPYTILVESEGLSPQSITDVYLSLGDTYTFSVALTAAQQLEAVTVTASTVRAEQVALGPSVTFNLADLEDAPAINRNINDVIAIDPRVYVDEAFNDSVQCGGANSRFNSLTVDGVRMNDNFGLNSNGFPTERMPFPYDAIEQVAVELAPFDVNYGGFTACNINAVTKSGTNEFHASAFYDYTDDSLQGDQLEGDDIDQGSFEEKRYGVTLGGPIVRDKLFFFAAYEKLEGANIFPRGPADASVAVPVLGVTQAQLDRIAQIARDVYEYEVGGVPPSLPNEDEKYLLKLDWEINENHRASYTYTFNDGFNITESDDGGNQFEFSDHYYERGAELESNVVQLFSSWGDNLTTNFRVSRSTLDNRQLSLNGTEFGEVQIRTFNDPDGAGPISSQLATVFFGADDSRHSNKLDYETMTYKLSGSYTLGDHVISAGLEREEFDVFNLFIQHTQGEFRFDAGSQCSAANPDGCIDAFEAGRPDDLFYGNAAPTNIPEDGSAEFGYEINTFYVQDEFPIAGGAASIVAGVRYDWYTSGDEPRNNANFFVRNGFTNTHTFDGTGLVQPRLGFNWDVSETVSLRGGAGLYSGGNPNVWLSNNYSNDGVTVVQGGRFDLENPAGPSLFDLPHDGSGRPLHDIPVEVVNQVTSQTANSSVNALDPNFKVPKEWKFTLGATWDFDAGVFGDGYRLMLDYLHTKKEDSAIIVDTTLEQIGTLPDGRPRYRQIDRSDPDCVNPTAAACSLRLNNQDFLLTNVEGGDGSSDVWSLGLSKSYDWGLDWTFGYAYVDSEEVSPMTSSVAFSNYVNISVSDPNGPDVARSNYNVRHRFTLQANYRRAFFGDYRTKFTLFGRMNEGVPYSPVFTNGGAYVGGQSIFGDNLDFRHLIYVPTGPTDPNVIFGPTFDTNAFFAYLDRYGLNRYAGRIAPRNSLTSHWWNKFDIKVEQELPSFIDGHKFAAYFMIENLGNLINDNWGVLKEQGFPRNHAVVQLGNALGPNGQYMYNQFFSPAPQERVSDPSLWELRFGIRYSF